MKIFKFYPDNRSKFHFGDSNGKLKEIVSSEQLFSALYNCAVLLYGSNEAEKILSEWLHNILFSSLYYGMHFLNLSNGESKELFFLSRPLAPINSREEYKDLLNHKKTKKIKYFSVEAFRLLRKSWRNEGKYFDFNLLDLEILGRNFACTIEEMESLGLDRTGLEKIKLFVTDARPRVVVSRLNDRSENFYYQEEIEVTYQQAGDYLIRPFMYFVCSGEIDHRLMAAVRLMADEGLGGKRSQGMGALGKVKEEEWDDEFFSGKGQYYMSLSSIYPGPDEVDKLAYYEMAERSGYIYSQRGRSLRKKRVRLLKEGSILSGKISGKVIDISPEDFKEHKVYLNGKAFLIPIGEV
jgi:CRISPR-associated protein Csm4